MFKIILLYFYRRNVTVIITLLFQNYSKLLINPFLGKVFSIPIVGRREGVVPYLAPKPQVAEYSNFACGQTITQHFWFRVDIVIMRDVVGKNLFF